VGAVWLSSFSSEQRRASGSSEQTSSNEPSGSTKYGTVPSLGEELLDSQEGLRTTELIKNNLPNRLVFSLLPLFWKKKIK
jgi:hypothetical protein